MSRNSDAEDSREEHLATEAESYTPSSSLMTVVNMVNNIIGAGVLSLPWAFAQSGWIGGFCLLALIALFSGMSMTFLVRAAHQTNLFSYPNLAGFLAGASLSGPSGTMSTPQLNAGKPARWPPLVVSLCMVWYTFGVLLLYTVSLGEMSHCLTSTLFPETAHSPWLSETAIKIYSGVFFFLLSWVKSFAHLGFTSFIAFATIAFTAVLMAMRYFSPYTVTEAAHAVYHSFAALPIAGGSAIGAADSAVAALTDPTATPTLIDYFIHNANPTVLISEYVLRAAPAVSLAYCMHYNVPLFYQQLASRTPARMYRVAAVVMVIVVAVYIVVAATGYATFGPSAQDVIVLMYIFPPASSYNAPVDGSQPLRGKDVWFVVAAFGIVSHFLFVYPLICIACRNAFVALCTRIGSALRDDDDSDPTVPTIQYIDDAREPLLRSDASPGHHATETLPLSDAPWHVRLGMFYDRNECLVRVFLTAVIVTLCVAVACLVRCVSVVLVFNGAICGVFIVYIFPALLTLAIERRGGVRFLAYVMIVFGLFVGIGGVALQVRNMILKGPMASCEGACTAIVAPAGTSTPEPLEVLRSVW